MSSLIGKFNELLAHLNSEDNVMALELRAALEKRLYEAGRDKLWRECLESGGVDNWSWFSESLHEGGYYSEDDDDE